MFNKFNQFVERHRHHLTVMAFVVLGMSCAFALYFADEYFSKKEVYSPNVLPVPAVTNIQKVHTLGESEPKRLLIPQLNIDAGFEEPLELNADKTIEVPKGYTTVGWYKLGSTPGELGPAIILGHVDSVDGAAVFYNLGQLMPGDRFTIERADGSKPEFEVTALERYDQDTFPTDLVYGPINYAGIRLITCSGTYNRITQKYDRNLVVYGRLVEPK